MPVARTRKAIGSDPLDDILPAKHVAKGKPSTVDRVPSTPGGPWDKNHTRVTFHCPKALLREVEEEMKRSGRSKSRVIVDAITKHIEASR